MSAAQPPTGLSAKWATSTSLLVRWTPTSDPTVGGYALNTSIDGGASWQAAGWVTDPKASETGVFGLRDTVDTKVRIRSVVGTAASAPVDVSAVKSEPKPEPPPVEPPPISSMLIGADIGGWGSIFSQMASEGIKLFRSGSVNHIVEASKSGVAPLTIVFGEGGTIGKINPTSYAAEVLAAVKAHGLTRVEVLNEPGGSWFWTDPSNYTAYVALLKATHEALAGTGCKVLASWDGGVGGSVSFGEHIKTLGALNYCDEVTVHPYGGSSGQYGGALGDRAKIGRAREQSGKPIAITEVGWPTATGQPSTGDSQQWTEAQQAENIESLAAWCREQGYISALVIYNLINAADTGTAQYGVWKHTLAPKLGAKALTEAIAAS